MLGRDVAKQTLREVNHHEEDHFGGSVVGFRDFLYLDVSAFYSDVPARYSWRQDSYRFWAASA
jgi:hypothetical protein